MKCKKFDSCSAPLCPIFLNKHVIAFSVWYTDEMTCINPSIRKDIDWIKIQRKLKNKNCPGGFTIKMLNRINRASKRTKGLDDIENLADYKKWLREHPKPVFSEEAQKRRKAMIEHMKWIRKNYLFDVKNKRFIRGFLGQWSDPGISSD